MKLDFKKWFLTEVGTGTNCVAVFARPIGSGEMVKRTWPPMFGKDKDEEDEDEKKKK